MGVLLTPSLIDSAGGDAEGIGSSPGLGNPTLIVAGVWKTREDIVM